MYDYACYGFDRGEVGGGGDGGGHRLTHTYMNCALMYGLVPQVNNNLVQAGAGYK